MRMACALTMFREAFEGVISNLKRRYRETESEWAREGYRPLHDGYALRGSATAPRLRPEALAVKIDGCHIKPIGPRFSVRDAQEWFGALPGKLDPKRAEIAKRILKEISERLSFLVDVGLGYLTLGALGHTVGRREPAYQACLSDRNLA